MDKNTKIYNIADLFERQRAKFRNTMYINIILAIGVLMLLAVNIVSSVKDINNPPGVRIILYIVISFLLCWTLYTIIKNIVGIIGTTKALDVLRDSNFLDSNILSINTTMFLYGSYYSVIDEGLSSINPKSNFHMNKKFKNLKFLNIKLALISLFIDVVGILFFVLEVNYFKTSDLSTHWELIFGLVMMIAISCFVIFYLLPRQIILNVKIDLNNKKKIDEYNYFFKNKIFCMNSTLGKFWNK